MKNIEKKKHIYINMESNKSRGREGTTMFYHKLSYLIEITPILT